MQKLLFAASLCALLATSASAQTTFVETFDSGNEGNWWYGIPTPPIEMTGGNPGAYLREPLLDTFAPSARTQDLVSEFTGNYVSRDVTSIGIDLITLDAMTAGGRPCALMLVSGDEAAFTLGPNIPLVGEGWISYDFDIPAPGADLPPGWASIDLTTGLAGVQTWETFLSNVERVQFFYGNPEYFFIFQQWDIGLDNPRITSGSGPSDPQFDRGDANNDASFDIADPIFVLGSLFVAGSPAPSCADAADSNDDGGYDISDAIFSLSALFVAGSPNPASPFGACGIDPTMDPLGCDEFAACP